MPPPLARTLLALFGWRVEPDGLPEPKGVLIVDPRTSNRDFVLGLLARWAVGLPIRGPSSFRVEPNSQNC